MCFDSRFPNSNYAKINAIQSNNHSFCIVVYNAPKYKDKDTHIYTCIIHSILSHVFSYKKEVKVAFWVWVPGESPTEPFESSRPAQEAVQ